MPLFARAITVKTRLASAEAEDEEVRKLVLPQGSATTFGEALALFEERFGRPLDRRLYYQDEEGDTVTVTTDLEFQEALQSGVQAFRVRAAPIADAAADWEIVDLPGRGSPAEPQAAVEWSSTIRFWLNGAEQVLVNPSPSLFLVDWLREYKGLTGTKVGCHEGGCGACTVAITFAGEAGGQPRPVTSCLRRLCSLDGCHVVTTEGIGSKSGGFNVVQKAIADGNGSQCGYCTPGWVMNMYAFLQNNPKPSRRDVEENFDGNLCRCTGFRPILSAFGEFAEDGRCCSKSLPTEVPVGLLKYQATPLHFVDHMTGEEWYRPLSMGQIDSIKEQAKTSGKAIHYVCAFSSTGVTKYYAPQDESGAKPIFVDLTALPELQATSFDGDAGLAVGSAVPISQLISVLESHSHEVPAYTQMALHLKRIASVQIRSVASWAGNLMLTRKHPTFASDAAIVLSTAGAVVTVLHGDALASKLEVTVPELLALTGEVLVLSMRIPALPRTAALWTFKAAQRSVFSHAIVNMGAFFAFDGPSVTDARIFVGGAAETMLAARKTAASVVGQHLDQAGFTAASAVLLEEIRACPSTDPRNTPAYREALALHFLYKAFLGAKQNLPPTLSSAIVPFIPAAARPVSSGNISYGTVPSDAPVGTFVPKLSSRIQASGESAYASDSGQGALVGQVVFSTAANSTLTKLNPAEALGMPGVVAFIGADAIPGKNLAGPCPDDKVFFAVGDRIPCVGVQLGMVVASTYAQAHAAAKRVEQVYSTEGGYLVAQEPVRSATQADIARGTAFLENPAVRTRRGLKATAPQHHADGVARQVGSPRADADKRLQATFKTGGQYHFYMETQCTVARPQDGDRWEISSSDQWPSYNQTFLAIVLGVPQHNINCVMSRAGGGFGGKLTKQVPLSAACAVAARKLRQPVMSQYERSDDMRTICGREPINFVYDVTFDSSGKVDSMDCTMDFFSGWFYGDASGDSIMAQQWSDNCYFYNSFKAKINPMITSTPHTTSCRAPGALQSLIWADVVMEHVAKTVGRPLEEVQYLNFYKPHEKTPFGDTIGEHGYNWTIPTLWEQIQKDADFAARKESVEKYNNENRWTKRGIALMPVKYIANNSGAAQYSSGATVCVYADGTVLINHGGCEIGQGINTVVALCAAQTLGLPVEKISIGRTETAKVPNQTGTGGSGTTETTSQAVTQACKDIADRLQKYRADGETWEAAVTQAIKEGVGLVASSWFVMAPTGNQQTYATYGVAVGETQVDVLTGEIRIERVDILMDLGNQLDAAVDIGQLEGGFVQALGYLISEELMVDARGEQLNLGTWNYKIPSAYDIPVVFNCSLMKDSPNPVGIRGSKMCAEPVMGLVSCVYFAVKQAIYAARKDAGLGDAWFMLDLPITPQRVCTSIATPMSELRVP